MAAFLCLLFFYFHHYDLLNGYIFFALMRQTVIIFLPNLSFINPVTFLLLIIFLIHNLKYQILLQHLLQCIHKCLLILCKTLTSSVSMSYNFVFSPYFGYTQSYQKSYISILLTSNIDRPKKTAYSFYLCSLYFYC